MARNVARARLMDSKEPVIYVTDGCAPGKDTVPVRYGMESLGADLAAVIIGVPCVQESGKTHGQATASPSAALRKICGGQRRRAATSCTFMCQCWSWRSFSP